MAGVGNKTVVVRKGRMASVFNAQEELFCPVDGWSLGSSFTPNIYCSQKQNSKLNKAKINK